MIKSSVTENTKVSYPCLKKWVGPSDANSDESRYFIVMFTAPKTGVVVYDYTPEPKGYAVGHDSTSWTEEEFVPFVGSVTLHGSVHHG